MNLRNNTVSLTVKSRGSIFLINFSEWSKVLGVRRRVGREGIYPLNPTIEKDPGLEGINLLPTGVECRV